MDKGYSGQNNTHNHFKPFNIVRLCCSLQAFGSNGPIRMQIPSFPALPWPSNIPFPQFSKFPTFSPLNTIKPFTFQGITAQGGTSGGQFNGVAVVSHQQTTNKKDGKLGTTGGSTMVFNDNGKITVQQSM